MNCRDACRLAATHPRNIFSSVKRLIGQRFEDVKDQLGMVRVPVLPHAFKQAAPRDAGAVLGA